MYKKPIGEFFIVLSSASFGIMPILAKFAYNEGSSTYEVLSLRFIFAALIIYFYLLINKISLKIDKQQLFILLTLGIVGYAGTSFCLFTSYKYIPVGLASMLLYTYPILVTIMSYFLYKEELNFFKILSLIFSIIGLYFIVGLEQKVNLSFKGIILALISAFLYSFYVMSISYKKVKPINSFVIAFYISLSSSICLMIIGWINGGLKFNISLNGYIYILTLSLISTVVALMAFAQGVKLIGPSKAAIISILEPLVGLILGIIIFKDKISSGMYLGSGLIIVAVILLYSNFNKFKNLLRSKLS